jgi:DNA-binding SARP family transcriptional activator
MLRVCCLGQFRVEFDGRPIDIHSRLSQSLFAYLTIHAGLVHRREKLAGLFWSDISDDHARAYLRHSLWEIHKGLVEAGADWREYLFIDHLQVVFLEHGNAFIDTAYLLEQKNSEEWCTEDLLERVQYYKGELLPGFYDEWVMRMRRPINAAFHQKMSLLLDRLESEQRWEDLLYWSEHWISFGQVPERGFRGLMIAHAAREDYSALSAAYQHCQRAYAESLGILLPAELELIYQRLMGANT